MLAVDIFTKQVEGVPMMLKDKDNIIAAFFELFKNLEAILKWYIQIMIQQ